MNSRTNQHSQSLFKRYEGNPILSAADWPYACNSVFNPGATRLATGETLLMCRVEDQRGHSHLCAARSADGLTGWKIDETPTLLPDPERHPEEIWGVEDCRITFLPQCGRYALSYTSFSRGGPCVSLALTEDFHQFERMGSVQPPEDKDAALFPRRFGGRWAMIHRPVSGMGAHMWISYSPDFRHWGGQTLLLEARRGSWWDANKIGLSPPPIETPQGWLILYHGVRTTASGSIYRIGLALLDLERPDRCLRRTSHWVFAPEAAYEREGDVANVVFPCGYTIKDDGDTLLLYYGAADTCIGVASCSIRELLACLMKEGNAATTPPLAAQQGDTPDGASRRR